MRVKLIKIENLKASDTVSFNFKDDSKDLSTWERGAPAPQYLSELFERQSGAGAPRSLKRRTSFLQDLVSLR